MKGSELHSQVGLRGGDRLRFQDEGKGVNLMFMIGDWVEGVKCLGLG